MIKFTVGDCGMPMELARCPECGAQVGGQDHSPAAGVRRAEDFDRQFAGGAGTTRGLGGLADRFRRFGL